MLGKTKPTDYANIDALVKKYGNEVYGALEIAAPMVDNSAGKGRKKKRTGQKADLEIVIESWPYLTEEQKERVMGILGDTGAHEKSDNPNRRRSKAATAN